MQIKLSFLGAAQNVTGSRYLVEANNLRILVDCGLYQEWQLKARNWEPFPVPPESIDAVLLTHAHLDHCGMLPKLVCDGFRGPIYATEATAEITEIELLDSAHLMMEDAEFKRKRHQREGRKGTHPEVPLYTTDDAKAAFSHFSPVKYSQVVEVGKGIRATFHNAGHTLGAAAIRVTVEQGGAERTILFSGDLGKADRPILRDPATFKEADYVIIESTYGDRLLELPEEAADRLAEVVNDTVTAGGNIVIPTFAQERAQEILYDLNNLLIADRIPHLLVFLDSPMAVSITQVFERHPELYDTEMTALVHNGQSPFKFPGLHMIKTADESKAINRIKGTVIILAGSGMCTGGRIKHHLVTNISRPDSTILFVGYQAAGTLGRLITDGAKQVRIHGQHYPVRAKIVQINGFSSHADRDQLMKWLSALQQAPRRVFVTHGEPEAAQNFASFITELTGWKATVPQYRDTVELG
ncbi:MAG: MBL fold metallo-hydrolase [Dehalococcoidales bacterium]|nr:MBL fold metallo-hydrolase [Dehalococcoidales bacterium]